MLKKCSKLTINLNNNLLAPYNLKILSLQHKKNLNNDLKKEIKKCQQKTEKYHKSLDQ